MAEVTGLLLVDKPAGQSSFGVLRGLRPALGRKLGHAGTLDPFATGLLLVLAGRATRLAAYLSGLDKRYEAVVQFGAVSTTLDPEGTLEPTGATTDADAVAAAAAGMTGDVMQAVPSASTGSRSAGSTRRASARRSPSSARRAPTSARSRPTSARRRGPGPTASSSAGPASAPSTCRPRDRPPTSRPIRPAGGSWRPARPFRTSRPA